MEVHSSLFVATIRKLVYGIIDLLRLVKAHKINDCKLVGFALPKIKCKRYIVKVTVIYKCALQKFKCEYEKIDFKKELIDAISHNMMVLKQCQKLKTDEYADKFLFALSSNKLQQYGANPIQVGSYYGLIIEASDEESNRCIYKIPLFKHSCYNLHKLTLLKKHILGTI